MNKSYLWLLVGFALLIRLVSLAFYPLMDSTEARYAEMARIMAETGNWLTPYTDYGVPFWGKPPLFAWLSAAGINAFGLNEFAVRLPHWLCGVATIFLASVLARRTNLSAVTCALVLATCGLFSIASGAVMTDMALTLSITITMVGFYCCWAGHGQQARLWGYLAFFGLACGLLAKGPVAIVMVALAICPWLILQHGVVGAFKAVWHRFPLVSGLVLVLAISLPWYILEESATPGFIDYFIVGEHFKRFMVSGWQGDLYGFAHHQPIGMIWLFWVLAAMPWSIVLPVLLFKRRGQLNSSQAGQTGLASYLVCWLLSPLILFTLAHNILVTYVLPGLPALGLLIAMLVTDKDVKWLAATAASFLVVLVAALVVLNLGEAQRHSDRVMYERMHDQAPVFYVGDRPFSGQFYSLGIAKKLESSDDLSGLDAYHLIGKAHEVDVIIEQNSLNCFKAFTAESNRSLYDCGGAM